MLQEDCVSFVAAKATEGITTVVLFGDVNGDGAIDLFVGNMHNIYNPGTEGLNELWINTGTGTFNSAPGNLPGNLQNAMTL